jgi:hypothetical protein
MQFDVFDNPIPSALRDFPLVPRMTSVAATDLRRTKAQLATHTDDIGLAIDLLFLGV